MSVAVCCPNCWTWSELRKATTCKRCRTPLILPDGRRVDGVPLHPPETDAPPSFGDQPAVMPGAPVYSLGPPAVQGTDWIAIARWITIGYGALSVIVILAIGLLVRHLTIPVVNPTTGAVLTQTVDIGVIMVIGAAITAVMFAVGAWLVQFPVARMIMLGLMALSALAALARMNSEPSALVVASFASLAVDLGFGFVLVMSLIQRPRPAY